MSPGIPLAVFPEFSSELSGISSLIHPGTSSLIFQGFLSDSSPESFRDSVKDFSRNSFRISLGISSELISPGIPSGFISDIPRVIHLGIHLEIPPGSLPEFLGKCLP